MVSRHFGGDLTHSKCWDFIPCLLEVVLKILNLRYKSNNPENQNNVYTWGAVREGELEKRKHIARNNSMHFPPPICNHCRRRCSFFTTPIAFTDNNLTLSMIQKCFTFLWLVPFLIFIAANLIEGTSNSKVNLRVLMQ